MKKSIFQMVFKGICCVLLTMITTNGMAQYDHLSKEQKEQKSITLINKAKAFVLGTPIDSECFYGEDGKTIYTKIKVRVKHWYKGEGKRNIYLIVRGGIIGADEQVSLHNPVPVLHSNVEYFMLLNKDSENYRFVSNIKASYGRYANIYSDNPIIVAFYGMTFDSTNEINEFLENLNNNSPYKICVRICLKPNKVVKFSYQTKTYDHVEYSRNTRSNIRKIYRFSQTGAQIFDRII